MRCSCGNEVGKPLVSPRPITIRGLKKDEDIRLIYMGGIATFADGTRKCWFCAFTVRGV